MTGAELREKQSWTLEQKVAHSLDVISSFVNRVGGVDKVYVSVSGGKDSDVLLHLCRMLYPDIQCVFINTGNEYPEILRHIDYLGGQYGANIKRLRPAMTPRQVFEKIGFPLVSKEVSQMVEQIKKNPDCATSRKYLDRSNRYGLAQRWRYLLDEPYDVSHKCCKILKKDPAAKYERETGRRPIIGIMASESHQRKVTYINRGGCNSFSGKVASWPLAIWTEEDIWAFIKKNKLRIASIYNKGASRTGCVGCGFGGYMPKNESPSLYLLYKLYPKYYEMIMNYTNNGVRFYDAVKKMKQVTNLKMPEEYDRKRNTEDPGQRD